MHRAGTRFLVRPRFRNRVQGEMELAGGDELVLD